VAEVAAVTKSAQSFDYGVPVLVFGQERDEPIVDLGDPGALREAGKYVEQRCAKLAFTCASLAHPRRLAGAQGGKMRRPEFVTPFDLIPETRKIAQLAREHLHERCALRFTLDCGERHLVSRRLRRGFRHRFSFKDPERSTIIYSRGSNSLKLDPGAFATASPCDTKILRPSAEILRSLSDVAPLQKRNSTIESLRVAVAYRCIAPKTTSR
jgi:hypothetical protein